MVPEPIILYFIDPQWSEVQYAEYLDLPGSVFHKEGEAFILGLEVEDELFIDLMHGMPSDEFWRELKLRYSSIVMTLGGYRWKADGRIDVLVGPRTRLALMCLDVGFTLIQVKGFGKIELKFKL